MAQKRKNLTPKDPRKNQHARRIAVRKRVLAAYDVCAICGKEVDKTLPQYHPLAPEVDEIIPVSRGGSPYDFENLQLTHRICNEKKGNKLPTDGNLNKIKNPTPNSRQW